MKRWLAPVLTIAILLGDCGNIPVFATEDAPAVETSVSENNTLSDEMPADPEETNSMQDEITSSEPELPALHIGQIKKGEKLPAPDDTEFVYDLSVSFETSDHVLLFADHNRETGTLIWSILRGEKKMPVGSTSLVDEEDDWTGFETVSASPYFTMTENKDEDSDYYKTVELAPGNVVDADEEDYNYYIRAAYYLDKDEAFYAAVTVPFLPKNDTDIDNDTSDDAEISADIIPDDLSDTEKIPADIIKDDMAVTEDTDQVGNPDVTSTEETDIEQAPGETVSENSTTLQAMEAFSTLALSEADDTSTKESFGVLTLSAESMTLHTGETLSVSATVVSENPSAEITWASSKMAVATVDKTGKITAVAAGDAQITAKCGDMTASVKVKVVAPNDDEVYDLSNDIWIDGFQRESDDLVYTGQKITQDIRVYHKETLLQEKTDYTLSYKNNINAAAYNSAKAPGLTITLKGQYQGSVTLYYTIKPADINHAVKENSSYEQAVIYTKNLNIPNPVLTFAKKKLAVNRDFVCDYSTLPAEYKKGDSYEVGTVYTYTVKGVGNFTGSFPMQLVIVNDKNMNFSAASVTLDQKQYEYHGTTPTDVKIKTLKINNKLLTEDLYTYEVCAEGIEGAYVMVYPTDAGREAGYRGCKKVSLKLVGDREIKYAALGENWKERITFSQKTLNEKGDILQEKTGVLTFKTETKTDTLEEDVDYTVKYSNAKKAGTVTVTFTGKGRYKGTLRKQYVIEPNINKNNFTIGWKNVTKEDGALVIAYQKGGATPDFALLDQDNTVLKSNTDYTVALKNNKTPGTSMNCVITGKGNYKGYTETVQIMVKKGDISRGAISIPDKPYSQKQNAWKAAVTIIDVNGKKLAAGTDYEKEIAYNYENMEDGQLPAAGSTVTATVTGKGCYEGSQITGSYRIFQNNISKLQIVIDDQEYTGKEITLSPEDIHVYASAADKKNKIELPNAESCYNIVEYKNNIKAGTAKVTLQGNRDYGGTKTFSFRILKKAFGINHVKKITLSSTTLPLSMIELQEENTQAGTLTATITSETAEKITNSTVIWSSSNINIATVEDTNTDTIALDSTSQVTTATSTVRIRAKKEGTVTITATTQDGNKKAICKVTITNKPVFTEDGQAIKADVNKTYQLHLQYVQTDTPGTAAGVKWESDRPDVVSVDETGLLTMKKAGVAIIKVSVSKYKFTGQCYAIAVGNEDEEKPEGKVYTYRQKPGTTNDTPAINEFLRGWEHDYPNSWEYLYIPAGIYHIDAVSDSTKIGGIILTSNQKLVMSPGTLLIAIGNSSENYQVIYAFGRDNITISGGQIVGERNEHKGKGGEWGHGISIQGCTNVTIENIEISQCWGDGIYLGLYNGWDEDGNRKDFYSNGVTIENCNLHDNRRNNLSVTDVSNVTISNCQFNYAKGTAPQYGIDIEPNKNRTCSNVTISDSTFRGNTGGTIQILGQLNAHVKDVTIENCTGDKTPVIWQGYGGSVSDVTENNNNWKWK